MPCRIEWITKSRSINEVKYITAMSMNVKNYISGLVLPTVLIKK